MLGAVVVPDGVGQFALEAADDATASRAVAVRELDEFVAGAVVAVAHVAGDRIALPQSVVDPRRLALERRSTVQREKVTLYRNVHVNRW